MGLKTVGSQLDLFVGQTKKTYYFTLSSSNQLLRSLLLCSLIFQAINTIHILAASVCAFGKLKSKSTFYFILGEFINLTLYYQN